MINKKIKCEICKEHRADRFCIRKAKNICWHCCNDMRADGKCPKDCSFSPKKTKKGFQLKVFSQTEYLDFFEKEADIWAITPQQIWNNKAPIELLKTEKGKKIIDNFFLENPIPLLQVARIYKNKFNISTIDLDKYPKIKHTPEETGMQFLNLIILEDKNELSHYFYNSLFQTDSNQYQNFIKELFSIKIIKKMKYYDILSSAISQDKKTAALFYEINGKYDLFLFLYEKNQQWKIKEIGFASQKDFFARGNTIKLLANYLAKKKVSEAYKILSYYDKLFFTYPDLYYYWAVYYKINGNLSLGLSKMEKALTFEPDYIPFQLELSTFYILLNKLQKAGTLLEKIIEKDKNNLTALNNLANIYIKNKRYDKARLLFERCLQINPNFTVAKENLKKLATLQNPSL